MADDTQTTLVSEPAFREGLSCLSPVDRVYPTPAQLEVLQAQHPLRLLPWGNRSGKTTVGGLEVVMAATGCHPWYDYPPPPIPIWIVGISNSELDKTVRAVLDGDNSHPRLLPPGTKWNEQKRVYTLANGSRIFLISDEGGEQARRRIQGAAIPLIWIDEEVSEALYDELLFRAIGANFKPRVLYSMTALKGFTYPYWRYFRPWEEARAAGKGLASVFVSVKAIYDNPHLDSEAVATVSGLSDNIIKRARLWGGFVDATQSPVFAIEAVEKLMREWVRPPLAVGELDRQLHFVHRPGGRLQVWEWPRRGESYVVGGDYGEGIASGPQDDGPDYTVFPCFNRRTGRQAALWRSNMTEPIPATNGAFRLCRFFQDAYFVPERNGPGFTGARHIYNRLHYGNVYMRRAEGRGDRPQSKDLGFLTDGASRDLLVGELRNVVREIRLGIYAREIVEEMAHAVYVPTPKGTKLRAQAQEGFHDDCWIATGLANLGFSEVAAKSPPKKQPEPYSWNWLDQQAAREEAARKGTAVWS